MVAWSRLFSPSVLGVSFFLKAAFLVVLKDNRKESITDMGGLLYTKCKFSCSVVDRGVLSTKHWVYLFGGYFFQWKPTHFEINPLWEGVPHENS